MEGFCYDYGTVRAISRHVDTGEPLPRGMFDKLVQARGHMAGEYIFLR
jgi:oligopeptidase A